MASLTPEQLNRLIQERRSIYPQNYTGEPVPREVIEQILENANWAPTHKLTEPWRFRVFYGSPARERLAAYLGDWYVAKTPADRYSEVNFNKTRSRPLQASCAIAICMQRDPQERLPEWEELAAVACAVQNMWLSCTAYGLGCYWSTPEAILEAGEFLELGSGERCLGLFYIGNHQMPVLPGKRKPVSEKLTWWDE